MKHKNTVKYALVIVFSLSLLLSLCACSEEASEYELSDLVTIEIDTAEYSENGIVKLTMHNNSVGEFSYGENYSLFRYKDGKWQPVPFIDTAFHEVTRNLKSSESTRSNINLTLRHGELPSGKYLLMREGSIKVLYNTDSGISEHNFTSVASGIFEIKETDLSAQ